MTPEESGIMRDAFYFLRDHIDPPPVGTDECVAFWEKAAKDLGAVAAAWKNHPLAMEVGVALYGYIETKCKAKGGGG